MSDRFSRLAADYARGRPGYPPELAAFVREVCAVPAARATVVDLGCGTGLSTRALRGGFGTLIGVDPSQPMLDHARAEGLAEERYLHGRAEQLPLADDSVDVFTIAQGLHWLDLHGALSELRRAGRAHAVLVAAWNRRPSTGVWAAYEATLVALCPEYAGIRARWDGVVSELDALVPRVADRVIDHVVPFDTARALALAASSSYVDRSPHRDEILARVEAGWTVDEAPYTCHAFAWALAAPGSGQGDAAA